MTAGIVNKTYCIARSAFLSFHFVGGFLCCRTHLHRIHQLFFLCKRSLKEEDYIKKIFQLISPLQIIYLFIYSFNAARLEHLTAEREVVGSIPGAEPILRVLK